MKTVMVCVDYMKGENMYTKEQIRQLNDGVLKELAEFNCLGLMCKGQCPYSNGSWMCCDCRLASDERWRRES